MPAMPRVALFILAGLVCVALGKTRAAEPSFVVVTTPGATERRLTREIVARIFLRKQNAWEHGGRIQPVNLPATSPMRRLFSVSVLGGPPEAWEDYWRDMYFHGVLPPHVLSSEEAVVLFVVSPPGAIGYVSTCAAAQRLTVVLIVGEVADCQR
jgi:ABC-type phosphate transport system substrate-binding protein